MLGIELSTLHARQKHPTRSTIALALCILFLGYPISRVSPYEED